MTTLVLWVESGRCIAEVPDRHSVILRTVRSKISSDEEMTADAQKPPAAHLPLLLLSTSLPTPTSPFS